VSALLPYADVTEVVGLRRSPIDPATRAAAAAIVEDVRLRGASAIREHGERFEDMADGDPLVLDRSELDQAIAAIDGTERSLLVRTAGRIRAFAEAQRSTLHDLDVAVPGGRAGHRWIPVSIAGAYAPGGRYPLPSSVLMTVIPARVAGVEQVWVASPRPSTPMIAAAAAAGADGMIAVGGAQAIAALAFGVLCPPCDVVVGPGNRWVTAAKQYLIGEIGIDALAGPSEIVVVADRYADPRLVAADLLAQGEHDPAALPILVTDRPQLVEAVRAILAGILPELPTRGVAAAALAHGRSVVVAGPDETVAVCEAIAPEHIALHVAHPGSLADRLTSYGSLFLGPGSAEVLADYGAGPNHVLPTGGTARYQSGLSVTSFLRSPTWMSISAPDVVAGDATALARLEGLEAHARAAEARRDPTLAIDQ
jgi:histidinol dehydrogenase